MDNITYIRVVNESLKCYRGNLCKKKRKELNL